MLITNPLSSLAYEVKSGDTMGEIAKSHKMSLSELKSLNPQIKNIDLIYIGEEINTNMETNTQLILKDNSSVSSEQSSSSYSVSLTAYEKDLLSRLVRAEAQDEPYIGKVAVAEVVLNRVNDGQFPDSIEEVIYQKNQFSPVTNGSIYKAADEDSILAVEEALKDNSDVTYGSLFFYNPQIATSRWLDSKPTVINIGNHSFKK